MRNILVFIWVVVLTGSCSIQHKHAKKEKIIAIDAGCGYAGAVSPEIDSVKRFIETKNDTALLSLASVNTIGNRIEFQLLAVIAIENILTNRPVKMSLLQEEEIAAFKKREDKVKVCSGCTVSVETTIHDLIKDKNNPARQIVDVVLNQ